MRQTLQTLFGLELSTAQKVIVASVVILVLLIVLGLFVRQIQGGRLRMKGQGGGRARQPRLGVVDTHDLDRQRQLILIRRDNVEHLIMIGGASDVVVETNILRSGGRAAAPTPSDSGATERPPAFETLPSPEPRQEPQRQEPQRQDPSMPPAVIAQPAPDMLPPLPVRPVQPAPSARQSQTQSQIDAAAMAAVGVATAISAAPAVQPPSFARDHASPTASPVELDSMARQLEEALKRPFQAVRPANSPGEPPRLPEPPRYEPPAYESPMPAARLPDEPKPLPIQEPAPSPEPAKPAAEASPVMEPALAMPTPTPPAPPVTTGRPVSLPADVEAELELALGLKPARANPPAAATIFAPEATAKTAPAFAPFIRPDPPTPPAPEPVVEAQPIAMAAPEPLPEPEPGPATDEPMVASEPEVVVPELAPSSPGEPVAAPEAVAVADAPQPEPEKKPLAIDPFSVDAIEAEFARLLGRDPKAKS